MDRRDFIKTGMAVSTAATLDFGLPLWLKEAFADTKGDLVAVLGGTSPVEMVQRTMEELGGMRAYIQQGDKVVIKPNIGWAKTPELGANTSPDLIGELVRMAVEAGAASVEVLDHTCQEWRSCYRLSGIEELVEMYGGIMVPANNKKYYKTIDLPKGKVLKKARIHEAVVKSDVWLNVPTLKHHGGANMSISMKNNMGIVWDRRIFHMRGLQQCIADLCTWEKSRRSTLLMGGEPWWTMVLQASVLRMWWQLKSCLPQLTRLLLTLRQ